MSALQAPFDTLPPHTVTDRQILWAILLALSGGTPGGGGTQTVRVSNGASFDIPQFDYQGFTYVGATNNLQTQVFKSGGAAGATVATLTYAYAAGGAADDDLITSITQS